MALRPDVHEGHRISSRHALCFAYSSHLHCVRDAVHCLPSRQRMQSQCGCELLLGTETGYDLGLAQAQRAGHCLLALARDALGMCAGTLDSQFRGDSALSWSTNGSKAAYATGVGVPGLAMQPSDESPAPLINAADIALLQRIDGTEWLLRVGTYGKVRWWQCWHHAAGYEPQCYLLLIHRCRHAQCHAKPSTRLWTVPLTVCIADAALQVWKGLHRGTQEVAIRKLAITAPFQSTQQLVDAATALCRIISSPHVVKVCSPDAVQNKYCTPLRQHALARVQPFCCHRTCTKIAATASLTQPF